VAHQTAPDGAERSSIPEFSVLIAAHDAESTLGAALDSLLAQTMPRWEALVVDDGSSDRTAAIAFEYAALDARISVQTQPNRGAAAARNAAATGAQGRWLLSLDADDLLLPEALRRQSAFISANPGFEIYSWGILTQAEDGSRAPWRVSAAHAAVEEFTLEQLIEGNLLTVMTTVSAERFRALGGFHDLHLEDYDLWLRALAAGARVLHNPELLAVYRRSESSKNTDLRRRWLGTAEVLAALAQNETASLAIRRLAARRAGYWRAVNARRELESRLVAGDHRGARRAYMTSRPAYTSRIKWLAGLPLMVASPALFTRVTAPDPIRDVPNVD